MKKRIVALLLCCVMLLTLSPSLIATATAEDVDAAQQVEQKVTDEQKDEAKDETKDEAKDETKDETKDEVKDETKDEAKDETKDEAKDETKDEAPAFDVKAAYDALMACTTAEDMIALSNKLTDEQIAMFSAEQIAALNAKYDALMPEVPEETDEGNGIVNFTDVAPFLAPVSGSSVRRAAARGVSTKAASNGVELNKTAVKTGDGYKITLEAFATGASSVVSSQTPTDIVLVLDQSGSMGYCIKCGSKFRNGRWSNDNCTTYEKAGFVKDVQNDGKTYYYLEGTRYSTATYCTGDHYFGDHAPGWYEDVFLGHGDRLDDNVTLYTSEHIHRLDALTTALTTFATNVQNKATSTANHRIAIVGFSSDNYQNTELLTGVTLNNGQQITSGQYYYYPNGTTGINGATNPTTAQYERALQDMSTANGQQGVAAAIRALTASGGTDTNAGLTMAEKILNNNPVANDAAGKPTRNRVVILFTDGDTDSDRGTTIQTAYRLKHTYGATVYTVGIFSGADGKPVTNWNGVSDANKLMHLLSSNFQNANSWNTNANTNTYPGDGKSYYLSASNANALDNIFQQISNEVGGSATQLDATATIKDIVTPYFTMPANAADVKLYTADSNGSTNDWKARADFTGTVTLNTEDNSVSVSGFSFKDNWCGTHTDANGTQTFHDGKKLIIEFTVKAKADFLGGNDVPTNGADSGIYDKDGTSVGKFDVPTVNVPIDPVTVTAQDKNVYLLGSVTADDLKSGAIVKVGNVPLDLSAENYGLEAWQNKYVDITVTVKDAAGNAIPAAGLTGLTDDTTTYTITVTVEPKTNGADSEGTKAETKTGSGEGKINVFKPVLTFKDSTAYYGGDAPAYTNNVDGEVWKHGDTLSTNVTMIGEKPELAIDYTPEAGKIVAGKINTKNDIKVAATVKIGNTDVTNKTTFVHQDCNPVCGWNVTTPNGNPAFLIHVKTCQLKITKTGGAQNEPYVFTVKKDGQPYTEVTIVGNNNVTIYELPVGTYTIEENTGWSWRYPSPTYSTTTGVALSADSHEGTIICTNTLDNNKWLNGFSDVVTNTFGAAHN